MTLNTGVAFAEHVSWRYFFYLNVPLVGIAALCVALFLDVKVPVTTRQEKLKVMDWMSFIFGLAFGGSTYPWRSPRTLVPLVVGAIGFPLWVYLERFVTNPTVPFENLRHRGSMTGYSLCRLIGMIQLLPHRLLSSGARLFRYASSNSKFHDECLGTDRCLNVSTPRRRDNL